MKKILIVLISLLILSTCFMACSKSKNEESNATPSAPEVDVVESVETTMSFVEKSVSIDLNKSVKLLVQGADGKTLTWRSANPEKLDVDQNGVVYAKMAGTVTVYASCGSEVISCTVTIFDKGLIPLVKLDLPELFQLNVGDDYNLTPYVLYDGEKYYDAEFTYSATGSVTVSANGVITATSIGEGKVTVTASWKGIQAETMTIEFIVNVI